MLSECNFVIGGELCETPLHIAVKNGAHDVIEYLLSKGALRKARNLKVSFLYAS